jgi:hypothetical protein
MATSGKDVQKNVDKLKRAMGLKGDIKPGDLTLKAREIMGGNPRQTKIPPRDTKKGLGVRGLV